MSKRNSTHDVRHEELEAWRQLAIARGKILAAYRACGRSPEAAIDAAHEAVEKLKTIGIDPVTGKQNA